MANYDDIFNASAQKGTEDKSFVSFNKEEWAAQKKQERESAFAMINGTLPPICPAGNEGYPGGAETEGELRAENQGRAQQDT